MLLVNVDDLLLGVAEVPVVCWLRLLVADGVLTGDHWCFGVVSVRNDLGKSSVEKSSLGEGQLLTKLFSRASSILLASICRSISSIERSVLKKDLNTLCCIGVGGFSSAGAVTAQLREAASKTDSVVVAALADDFLTSSLTILV